MLGLFALPKVEQPLRGARILRRQLKIQRAPSDFIKKIDSTKTKGPASSLSYK